MRERRGIGVGKRRSGGRAVEETSLFTRSRQQRPGLSELLMAWSVHSTATPPNNGHMIPRVRNNAQKGVRTAIRAALNRHYTCSTVIDCTVTIVVNY